jgi:hypothetical protein
MIWRLSKSYAHKNNCKKQLVGGGGGSNSTDRTNVRAHVFNAGLLARSQFASGRSCDQPTRSGFSVAFLGPRANAELVPIFHIALHALYAALPMVTLQIFLRYTDVTLTLGCTTLFMGDMSEGALHERERK